MVTYTRETFVSYPHQVICVRLVSDREAALNCVVRLSSPHAHSMIRDLTEDQLLLEGQVEEDGIHFVGRLLATSDDGYIKAKNDSLVISDATEAVLYLAVATNTSAIRISQPTHINAVSRYWITCWTILMSNSSQHTLLTIRHFFSAYL